VTAVRGAPDEGAMLLSLDCHWFAFLRTSYDGDIWMLSLE
jgi:hypothetical protein